MRADRKQSTPWRGARSDGGRLRGVFGELQIRARELRNQLTVSEARLWEQLQGRRLCGARFRCQHAVETFIFDFYCPEFRLVIEVDGSIHEQPDVKSHDAERQRYLEKQEYCFPRFTNTEIQENMPGVLDQIRKVLIRSPSCEGTDGESKRLES